MYHTNVPGYQNHWCNPVTYTVGAGPPDSTTFWRVLFMGPGFALDDRVGDLTTDVEVKELVRGAGRSFSRVRNLGRS